MRPEESAYWDDVAIAVKKVHKGGFNENIWKRCAIASRILAHRPIGRRVLEIGTGQGLGAAVVNLCVLGHMKYTGTDVSNEFCSYVTKQWKLATVQTDVLKLPDGPFDMIWAFDTLEHVRPEDRQAGYKEMARVLATDGMIMLNVPLNESGHDQQFDWGMEEKEVHDIAKATGAVITKYEPYDVPEVKRSYLWVEMERRCA